MTKPTERNDEAVGYLLREVQIHRYRDILLFLPVLAVVIFLSPIIDLASSEVMIFGVPSNILVFFSFWFLLILLFRMVNRRMLKLLNERNL